jgi:hypothetical protein
VSKKSTECIGQTRAEMEAFVIAIGAQHGLPAEEASRYVDLLLTAGFIKRCSVHPDHYISDQFTRAGRERRRRERGS